jgi:hypothetical protein
MSKLQKPFDHLVKLLDKGTPLSDAVFKIVVKYDLSPMDVDTVKRLNKMRQDTQDILNGC